MKKGTYFGHTYVIVFYLNTKTDFSPQEADNNIFRMKRWILDSRQSISSGMHARDQGINILDSGYSLSSGIHVMDKYVIVFYLNTKTDFSYQEADNNIFRMKR